MNSSLLNCCTEIFKSVFNLLYLLSELVNNWCLSVVIVAQRLEHKGGRCEQCRCVWRATRVGSGPERYPEATQQTLSVVPLLSLSSGLCGWSLLRIRIKHSTHTQGAKRPAEGAHYHLSSLWSFQVNYISFNKTWSINDLPLCHLYSYKL